MAYRADIEIAVKGAQELKRLQDQISAVSQKVKQFNADAARRGVEVKSITSMQSAVAQANQTMRSAAAGTKIQKDAIDAYVKSLDAAEKAELDLAQAIRVRQKELNITPTASVGTSTRGAIGKRFGGAISGAAIGGAFPLLFGQGGGAATGGAIGGLLGGLVGGQFSFALSLVGTLIGDIVTKGQKIKDLGQDIGFSAEQTKQLSGAFKVANTDIEKFTAVIQNIRGIGLELEDQAKAVQLVTRLTEAYGGSFEKTGNAITSALESGKVTQATLNQLTSQGINIQQALADKYGVSRSALFQMAKDGKISVQSLIDTLVDLGNKPGQVAKQTKTASEQFQTAIQNLAKIVGPELERLSKLFVEFGTVALNALNSVLIRLGQAGTAIENAVAGDTLKNAQTQFRRDATLLKRLYATPKEDRTQQQVQQITTLENLQKGRLEVINAAKPAAPLKQLETFNVPGQVPSGGAGSDKAAQLQKQIQEQLSGAKDLLTQKQAELTLTKAVSEEDKLRTKYEATRTERMQNYVKLLSKSLSDAERTNLVEAQGLDIKISQLEYEKELAAIRGDFDRSAAFVGAGKKGFAFDPTMNLVPSITGGELGAQAEAVRLELEKLISPVEQLKTAAEGIGTAFANSFKAAVSGAMSAQEALASFFQSVADRFLDMAAQIIAKWIEMTILNTALSLFPGGGLFTGAGPVSGAAAFSGAGMGSKGFSLPSLLPGRASGGSVSAGSPYMVGERGPELFVPGRSGTIVPNNALGGDNVNVVVNVDASGSKVQGDDAQANQLGRVVSAAVQQELIKQKRPGGLLA